MGCSDVPELGHGARLIAAVGILRCVNSMQTDNDLGSWELRGGGGQHDIRRGQGGRAKEMRWSCRLGLRCEVTG